MSPDSPVGHPHFGHRLQTTEPQCVMARHEPNAELVCRLLCVNRGPTSAGAIVCRNPDSGAGGYDRSTTTDSNVSRGVCDGDSFHWWGPNGFRYRPPSWPVRSDGVREC